MSAKITAAAAEKGGTGKSTTIQNFAVQLARRDYRVLLAELDPQGTTRKWGQRRREDKTEPAIEVREVTARGLLEFLERHADDYDHILLDTGGADSDGMRVALMLADIALCPCAPSQADVETLEHVNSLIGRAKIENRALHAYLFATMVPNHAGAELLEMREFCAGFEHLTLLDTVIGLRKAFRHALRDGLGVVEYPVDEFTRKAIEEMLALEQEIYQ